MYDFSEFEIASKVNPNNPVLKIYKSNVPGFDSILEYGYNNPERQKKIFGNLSKRFDKFRFSKEDVYSYINCILNLKQIKFEYKLMRKALSELEDHTGPLYNYEYGIMKLELLLKEFEEALNKNPSFSREFLNKTADLAIEMANIKNKQEMERFTKSLNLKNSRYFSLALFFTFEHGFLNMTPDIRTFDKKELKAYEYNDELITYMYKKEYTNKFTNVLRKSKSMLLAAKKTLDNVYSKNKDSNVQILSFKSVFKSVSEFLAFRMQRSLNLVNPREKFIEFKTRHSDRLQECLELFTKLVTKYELKTKLLMSFDSMMPVQFKEMYR